MCPLPCQNGGTGNNLCTECDCAAGYSGPECENCALENCFGCRDVPAVCDACDDGYVINTLRVCGKFITLVIFMNYRVSVATLF